MTKSIITSVRLDYKVNEQLEKVAHALNRKKNWIINEAIKSYLTQLHTLLAKEARRQAVLASKKVTTEEEV